MDTGLALKGFWERVVAVNPQTGTGPITYGWYRSFLEYLLNTNSYVWFSKLVSISELLIGIALVAGALVGVAAFFGALMNFNYMLAGTASTNPVLFIAALGLLLAWKTAGYYGLDRWLLGLLGTPWRPGRLFLHQPSSQDERPPAGSSGAP
jgi:thiosulfate dehydrogenase [quinone] large subunit